MSNETHPSTQLLERSLERIQGTILLVNPVELATVSLVLSAHPEATLTVSCQDYALYQEVQKLVGITALFETHHEQKNTFDQAVVFLPKSDAEIEMTLAWAAETLKQDGQLVLIGQNNAGIKSAKKTLQRMVGEVSYSDTARHSALYIANYSVKLKPFVLEDYWQNYEIDLDSLIIPAPIDEVGEKEKPVAGSTISKTTKGTIKIYSLPGVFSHGRLDEGTKELLESLGAPIQANHILDWGCGAGAVGAFVALRYPDSIVHMADTSALAIESSLRTITENKLRNCSVFPSNVFSDIPDSYDYIIANPPFHKGHDTHYVSSEEFLRQSKGHLKDHASLRIVANIFLRYEQEMEEQFGYVKVIAKTNKYKILETIKTPAVTRSKRVKHKKKRTLEEAGFVDIKDLDKLLIADSADEDTE